MRNLYLAVGLLLLAGVARAAAPVTPLDSGVAVALGFKMNVLSQTMDYTWANWTLFKDGSVYDSLPSVGPDTFDVAASRRDEPRRWGHWREQGKTLAVAWNSKPDVWQSYEKWFRLATLPAGQTLDGAWRAAGAVAESSAYRSSTATGWKLLRFHPDGSFEQSAGGSASDEQLGQSLLSAVSDQDRGSYKINGTTLELHYADGHLVRASLFFSGDDHRTMMLNGIRMLRR